MIKELTGNLPSAEEITRFIQARAANLPSADEIARFIQGRGGERDVFPGVALFGAGLLVGAGLALLFAPSSGEELRETLGRKMGAMTEERWPDEEREPAANGTPA
jgi:YtxH-like protein